MPKREPTEILRNLMEALQPEYQNTDTISKRAGVSWVTAWKYLKLIVWIQDCPKVARDRVGRSEIWNRNRGRLPD